MTFIDTYFNYNKKIYEYIFNTKIPEKTQEISDINPISIQKYYNNLNTGIKELFELNKCGFNYNFNENESSIPGSMYLTDTGISFTYFDINNKNTLYSTIEDSLTIVISDGIITHQFNKEELNLDPITGVITIIVSTDLKMFNDFFKINKKYTIYPCSVLEHADNVYTVETAIVDNNIHKSFGAFLGLFLFVTVVYNWKYFSVNIPIWYNNWFGKPKEVNNDELIDNIYYIGGYDYKDYSE
jgi:hypothetical protein